MKQGLSAEEVEELREWVTNFYACNNRFTTDDVLVKLDEMTRPKPIECWIIFYPNGAAYARRDTEEEALKVVSDNTAHGMRAVHMREVL